MAAELFFLFLMITILGSLGMILGHNRKIAELKYRNGEPLPSRNPELDELRRHVAQQNAIIAEMRTLLHQQTIALDDARGYALSERTSSPPPVPQHLS